MHTHGKLSGHLFRRCFHLSTVALPFLYAAYAQHVADFLNAGLPVVLSFCLLAIVLLESLRLTFQLVIFGQRDYERKKISSFAWGAFSLVLVLWLSPANAYYTAIIVSYALGDPLLGELRAALKSQWLAELLGLMVVLAVWVFCALWFDFALWFAFLVAFLTVVAEWAKLKWIDDNALMLLVPLLAVNLFAH